MTPIKPFQLGSISHGTLRTQDLLPAFADAIEDFGHSLKEARRRFFYFCADAGLLVHINDHGNVSVFDQQGNLLWDCV